MGDQFLQEKVALITGAGRGIGKAIALAYAQAGATVVCTARTRHEIEATANEIAAAGGKSLAITADVSLEESVRKPFDTVDALFGGLDILVINAGGDFDSRVVEESRPDDWRLTIDINLVGAYYCAQAAIPLMKRKGAGKIITMGSGLGHRGREGRSAYACAKAGLWMLTRVLAQELWQHNISVNELVPGPVNNWTGGMTPGGTSVLGDSEWIKAPEDVVPLALFLASQPDKGPTAQSFSLMRRDG